MLEDAGFDSSALTFWLMEGFIGGWCISMHVDEVIRYHRQSTAVVVRTRKHAKHQ